VVDSTASAWHALETTQVLRDLQTDSGGLSSEEAKKRLAEYGYNELKEKKRRTLLQMFLGEFKDVFILMLIAATIFSVVIGFYEAISTPGSGLETYADAIAIGIIVVLVAITGFVQEYRAEKALDALKRLAAPKARVLRNGKEAMIFSREVVPGDILIVETGDTIPADARILESVELKTDEAVLTGESTPVTKSLAVVKADTPIADQKNMLHMATHTVYGRARAVVVSTGMNTEFGAIAELVQTAGEEETPLQRKLDKFASKLGKIVIAICVIIFAIEAVDVLTTGTISIEGFIQAFMSSVSLAISAVPEGLPAVITVTLAFSARGLAKRNAIVRRLSSAETLGAVTFICSDKTGTLTKGQMTVRRLYVNGRTLEVTGVGYEPRGEFRQGSLELVPQEDKNLTLLLRIGALCSNADVDRSENDVSSVVGDPTEGALIVAAGKAGMQKKALEQDFPRVAEVPFTSERKRMTTVHSTVQEERHAYVKGAPEVVLEYCEYVSEDGKEVKLTPAKRKAILEVNEQFAGDALRVLAMAYRKLAPSLKDLGETTLEKELVFVGLEGMIDPPRKEAIEANRRCQEAGIKTVMITGDHKLNATAVAKEVGIYREGSVVLTGAELDRMSDAEFARIVENVSVYARVSPHHKLRIVQALKAKGEIVAMTGDGVNDAPAVKTADIGVSMGLSGTDVTREASDLVLTDDNFATMITAVEQGRTVYDNIRKYGRFLISCNFDELLVIGTFAILGGLFGTVLFPLPLLPFMILWINLVTDGAPAVALALDPPDPDIMKRPPRRPEEGILYGMKWFILASFILQSFGTIFIFSLRYYVFPAYGFGSPLSYRDAATAAFVQAAIFELFVVWNCRSETRSVWRMGRQNFRNKFFVIAEVVSVLATLGICYIPFTATLFGLVPLPLPDLLLVFGVASLGFFVLPELLMRGRSPGRR
jgi:Ca2+-transporting ATPase